VNSHHSLGTKLAILVNDLPFLHPGLFQVCYVTRDLDRGVEQLTALHGVERFRIKRDVQALPGMPAMVVHQAHVFLGDLQVELIQPAGGADAVYRDFCPADGSIRHHHFGLWMDDRAEYDALRGLCAARGVPIAFEIEVPGLGGAIYADLRRSLGHYMEYVHLAPQAKAAYYADVPRY
jgi:hypothetical protein